MHLRKVLISACRRLLGKRNKMLELVPFCVIFDLSKIIKKNNKRINFCHVVQKKSTNGITSCTNTISHNNVKESNLNVLMISSTINITFYIFASSVCLW